MATFVGDESGHTSGSITAQTIPYSPTLGNLVLVFLTIEGNGTTQSFQDNAGTDIFNNQLNTWELLGNVSANNLRTEVWGCPKVQAAFTEITVEFSEANTVVSYSELEYSSASVSGVGSNNNNGGYSNLFFNGAASNNSSILVCGFICEDQYPSPGSGTPWQPHVPAEPITPGVQRGNTGLLLEVQEQTVIVSDLLTLEGVVVNPSTTGIAALGVVLSGGLTLASPPGFSAVDAADLLAGDVLSALVLNQISLNAAFGMVRPEFFYTIQKNGDTVPTPISPVDGYNYQSDELIYIYTPLTTFDAATGWVSQAGLLFYCQWDVDQITGVVTCQEMYHPDGNTPINASNDGQLLVLTVAQRGLGALNLGLPPSLYQLPFSALTQDGPVTQTIMQSLANNSIFAAVKAEVIYMGEFVDGQVVPQPISPEDGYVYGYDEVHFMSSWRWTTNPSMFAPPPMATASGGNADGGWSQLNELQASVSATGGVNCQVFFQNHGVINPSDPDNGGFAFGRLAVFAFCNRNKGLNFGIPVLNVTNGVQSGEATLFTKIPAPIGTATGSMSITLAAGDVSGAANVSKVVLQKTLSGSSTVISTTNVTFSSSASVTIPQGTTVTSDTLSWTFDDAHDVYLLVVFSGTFCYANRAGNVNVNTPTQIFVAGDQSGETTVPLFTSPDSTFAMLQSIFFTLADANTADQFEEIPITSFMPGQPLLGSTMEQLAQNVQEGCYAVEFFGPTNHVNGDTIALPTSPVDGYTYERSELFYIWNWNDTGTSQPRLLGWGASISALGVVSTSVWHCPSGGPPTNWGAGGSEPADGSIDVITIATRSRLNQVQAAATVTSNPPTDVGTLSYGGAGGYTINGGS